MNDIKLGITPDVNAERDAIHIAVAPVLAACDLKPGTRVQLMNGQAYPSRINSIGIVDPFITNDVLKGERFWLLLHQNSITGMHHRWSHPAFDSNAPKQSHAPA